MQRMPRALMGVLMIVMALTVLVSRASVTESLLDTAAHKGTHVSIRAGRTLRRQAVVLDGIMQYGGYAIGAIGLALMFSNQQRGSRLRDDEIHADADRDPPDPDLAATADAFCASCSAPVRIDDRFCGCCGEPL